MVPVKVKALMALLVVGLVLLSAGCLGGGGKTTGSSGSSAVSSKSSSSSSVPTGSTSSTTSSPWIPEVSIFNLGKFIGKNVTVKGKFVGIGYNSTSHTYVLTIEGDGRKVRIIAKRSLLSVLNPITVGVGTTVKVTGEVKDADEMMAKEIVLLEPLQSPKLLPIGNVKEDMLGEIVVVEGNVKELKEIGSNLKLVLDDGTGEIAVFIPGSVVRELSNDTRSKLKEGLGVEVGGYLDEYKGTLEIIPYTASGIRPLGKPLGVTTSSPATSTTSTAETGGGVKWVTVAGLSNASGEVYLNATWVKLYYSNHNYLMEVSDESGKANLTVSRDLLPNPAEDGTGSLLELVVDAPSMIIKNLSVLNPNPSPLLSTANITPELMGRTVVVEGEISGFKTIGANLKFTVVDGTGNVTVFVPSSVAGKLPSDLREGLGDGAKVTVAGYVTEYKGTIEIIPYSPEGLKLSR
ncbi:OB-fold nucleic acid binding domain-containing protein [Thermococcus sp.]|uniref:OB-fold nucleic acid binding domain-containing protein n=1 Tax=Thermococcus sp. TaxID=35749 RepID=UPI00260ACCCC|nr:OB-fold nucleic acid binding domain-containing protein [Thermococcus sp.]